MVYIYSKVNNIININKGANINLYPTRIHNCGTFTVSNMRPTLALHILDRLFFWTTVSGKFKTYEKVAVLIF
jgi:hypothetical protein